LLFRSKHHSPRRLPLTTSTRRTNSATLRQQIYETLRGEILSGKLPAGQVLSEEHLAERYGASRTPIREVLTALSREHFVQRYARRGYQVVEFKLDDALDVLQARMLLEPEVAGLAAAHATEADADRLEQMARQMASAKRPGEENIRFHRAVAELSGNRLLAAMVEQLNERIWLFGRAYLTPLDPAESDRAHLALVEALRQRDAARARRVMQAHLRYTQSCLRRLP
jgi:DNA-binding GntR family transcriptional regulator